MRRSVRPSVVKRPAARTPAKAAAGGGRAAGGLKVVHLIDACAYYALPGSIQDPSGRQSNALVGFANFLVGYIETEEVSHLALCFDSRLNSSYRNEIYPDYKSNRPSPPDEFKEQVKRCRKFAEALGVACFDDKKYEADDIIATLGTKLLAGGHRCTVITSDKDLLQLVEPGLSVYDFGKDLRYDESGVKKKMGVRPDQVVDLQGLTGDAVDCIPGVSGIGPKTAEALLKKFGDLDTLYSSLDKVGSMKGLRGATGIQSKLAAGKDQAYLSKKLATLERKVPVKGGSLTGLQRKRPAAKIHKLLDDLGLKRLHDRVAAWL
jgi:5'-3' exonuclease